MTYNVFLGILLAAIANMILGMLWYNPLVFGKTWMKLTNIKPADIARMKKTGSTTKAYLSSFLAAIITAYVLAIFLKMSAASTTAEGAVVGLLAWLGFVATTSLGDYLYACKPKQLYWLNNGYNLISFILMAMIVASAM